MSLRQRVLAEIKEEYCISLIKELVPAGQPDAEDPLDPDQVPGGEEGISAMVAKRLIELGFEVEMHAGAVGRPDVVGRLRGTVGKPTLIPNDHLDTYPVGGQSHLIDKFCSIVCHMDNNILKPAELVERASGPWRQKHVLCYR